MSCHCELFTILNIKTIVIMSRHFKDAGKAIQMCKGITYKHEHNLRITHLSTLLQGIRGTTMF